VSLGAVYYLKNMCSFISLKFNARDILTNSSIAPQNARNDEAEWGKLSHQVLTPRNARASKTFLHEKIWQMLPQMTSRDL
jgi:hypothetical protein